MKGDGAQILIPISRPSYNSRYDVGLRAGVGVLINKRVNFDVAYIHGFTEIGYYYDRVVAANRVIQLSVGMPLKISRD